MSRQKNKDKAFEAFDQARLGEPVQVIVDPEVLAQIEAANVEAAQELLERKGLGRQTNSPRTEEEPMKYRQRGDGSGAKRKHVETKKAHISDAREQVQEAELPENVLRIP